MASAARQRFIHSISSADRLRALSSDKRLRPITYEEAAPPLHASLASYVSAWEAYVEAVVVEALDRAMVGATQSEIALIGLVRQEAVRAIDKFNTPNAENCRDLILRYTGCDVFPVMSSPSLGLAANFARGRLNEVMRVRHSFAHGFQIPSYSWTMRNGVGGRLSVKAIRSVRGLIVDFVNAIDNQLSIHMAAQFPGRFFW